jgi:hypothetical protein
MTITTVVNATWRMGHIEIDTPYDAPGKVRGVGEVLIEEPSGGNNLLSNGKQYGAIPGDSVTRDNEVVMDAAVEVAGGTSISWRTILEALPLFIEKWRREDIETPPVVLKPEAMPPTTVPDYRDWSITGPDQLPPPLPQV